MDYYLGNITEEEVVVYFTALFRYFQTKRLVRLLGPRMGIESGIFEMRVRQVANVLSRLLQFI
jgi:hypothetical protein